MKYFVDSSYIIALVNENDSLHEHALELLDLIEENECYINSLAISEAITVLGNKIDVNTAISTFNLLNEIFIVIDHCDKKDFFDKTMLIYEKYNAKLSFTDSSIIVNMENNDIENLISFDKVFEKIDGINLIS